MTSSSHSTPPTGSNTSVTQAEISHACNIIDGALDLALADLCFLTRPGPDEYAYDDSYQELLRFRHRLLSAAVACGNTTAQLSSALALMGNTAIRRDGAERLISYPMWEEGEVEGSLGDKMMSMLTGPVGEAFRADGEPLKGSDVAFLKRVKQKLIDTSDLTGGALSTEELADRLVLSAQDTFDRARAVSGAWLRHDCYIWSQRGARSVDTLLGNLQYLTHSLSLASYQGKTIADWTVKVGPRDLSVGEYVTKMTASLRKLIHEPAACKLDGVVGRLRSPNTSETEQSMGDELVSWHDLVYDTGPVIRSRRFGDLLNDLLVSLSNTSRWCSELETAVVRERGTGQTLEVKVKGMTH